MPDAPPPDPDAEARRDVDEQLGMSLEAIREIEMDHRAGNLSDEDFAALDAAERARAVELMRRADALRQDERQMPADPPKPKRTTVPSERRSLDRRPPRCVESRAFPTDSTAAACAQYDGVRGSGQCPLGKEPKDPSPTARRTRSWQAPPPSSGGSDSPRHAPRLRRARDGAGRGTRGPRRHRLRHRRRPAASRSGARAGHAPPPPAAAATAPKATPVVLRIGSYGTAVKDLQRELRRRGIRITVDGAFGPATKRAVKRIQKRFKMKPTGVADAKLLKRLGLQVRVTAGATTPVRPTVTPGQSPYLDVFPLVGEYTYSDDFGAPRHQGRHEGVDIMADRGTPIVAVVNGTVERLTRTETGLGGIYVWLQRADGTEYYYAHMNSVAGGLEAGAAGVRRPGDRGRRQHRRRALRRDAPALRDPPRGIADRPVSAPGGRGPDRTVTRVGRGRLAAALAFAVGAAIALGLGAGAVAAPEDEKADVDRRLERAQQRLGRERARENVLVERGAGLHDRIRVAGARGSRRCAPAPSAWRPSTPPCGSG